MCFFTTEGVSLLNAEVLDECAAKSQQKWCHCHQSRVGLLRNKLMSYQRHKMVARSSSQGDKAASSNNGSRAKWSRTYRTTVHRGATAEEHVADVNSSHIRIPDCWSREQYHEKKTADWPWMTFRNGLLGCLICREARSTSRISCECQVSAFGDSKPTKQQSLRKTIWTHKTSDAHQFVEKVLDKVKQNPIESVIAQHSPRINNSSF